MNYRIEERVKGGWKLTRHKFRTSESRDRTLAQLNAPIRAAREQMTWVKFPLRYRAEPVTVVRCHAERQAAMLEAIHEGSKVTKIPRGKKRTNVHPFNGKPRI